MTWRKIIIIIKNNIIAPNMLLQITAGFQEQTHGSLRRHALQALALGLWPQIDRQTLACTQNNL